MRNKYQLFSIAIVSLVMLVMLVSIAGAAFNDRGSAPNAYIPVGGYVSVVNTANDDVTIVDTTMYTFDCLAGGSAVNNDGSKAYFTSGFFNQGGYGINLSVFDTATNSISAIVNMGFITRYVAVSPDGSRVYVSGEGGEIAVVDGATDDIVKTVNVGRDNWGLVVSPDGKKLYVADYASYNILVLDAVTLELESKIRVGHYPMDVAITPDGKWVYVTNSHTDATDSYGDSVSVIDTATNEVVSTVTVGKYPRGIAITPDGRKAYVANNNGRYTETGGSVSVIDIASNSVVSTIPTEGFPTGISITPDGEKAYVVRMGNGHSSGCFAIDTSTDTISNNSIIIACSGANPQTMGDFIGGMSLFPVANFVSSATQGIGTLDVRLTDASQDAQSLHWDFGDGSSADGLGPFDHHYASSRNYRVNLTVSNAYGSSSSYTTISVLPEGSVLVSGPYAYITGGMGNIDVVDLGMKKVKTTIYSIGPSRLSGVSVAPDGKKAYATDWGKGKVLAIDTQTASITKSIGVGDNPEGVVISPDGDKAYVANEGSASVSVINVASDEVAKTIGLGDYPYGIAFNPAADEVYVTDGNDSVFVINTTDDSLAATIPVGSTPKGIAVTPDGKKAYVADWNEKNVSVIDLSQRRVIATVGVGFGPVGVAVSPDGKKVYVANGGSPDSDNTVSVIDTASDTLMYSITVGRGPHGIAITPDGKQVCVVCSDETLSIIDIETDEVVGTIENVGPSPIAFGQFMTPPKAIVVPPVLPFANFTSNVTEGYAPLDVQFNDSSENATHLEWNFGDNSNNVSDPNPEHLFTSTGLFNVVLTANNTNGLSSKNLTINVTAKPLIPVAGFTEDVKSGVAPLTVSFTDQSQYATTVNWDFNGDGVIEISGPPGIQTYTYATPGNYVVNQTVINSNGTNSTTDTISVTKAITPVKADFTFSVSYLAVQFTDTSTGTPNNWTWDYGDNNGSNASSPSYTYANAGTYPVTLSVKNADGSTDSITKSVTVVTAPQPSGLKINDFKADITTGYEPLTVHFTSDVSGSPTKWTWKFEKWVTQSFKVGTATRTFMDDGIYDVTLTVKDATGHIDTMTKPTYITVLKVKPPKADFSAKQISDKRQLEVQFIDKSKNNPTKWLWNFGDRTTSKDQNPPLHHYNRPGRYTVSLTVTNAGGFDKIVKNIDVEKNDGHDGRH